VAGGWASWEARAATERHNHPASASLPKPPIILMCEGICEFLPVRCMAKSGDYLL
jgi:hypothetical protein